MTPSRSVLVVAAVLVGAAAGAQACDDGSAEPSPDAGVDAGPNDGASADGGFDVAPRGRDRLSQTGLYVDIGTKELSADALAYEPAFALWSDGAEKKRWVRLPKGAAIDTTNPDHWKLPVGTQLFKEFSVAGRRIETRMIERLASSGRDRDEADYWVGSFLWRDDDSDADFVVQGRANARGTSHDVPSAEACWSCHVGEPGHVLGFSALQLSHRRAGTNLETLRADGRVPKTLADAPLPVAAIGYLHANCGHCHNVNGGSWPDTDMTLRWTYGESDLAASALGKSSLGVATRSFQDPERPFRIAPGDPTRSAVAFRMGTRVDGGAMPPLATETVDGTGVGVVNSWIAGLDGGQ